MRFCWDRVHGNQMVASVIWTETLICIETVMDYDEEFIIECYRDTEIFDLLVRSHRRRKERGDQKDGYARGQMTTTVLRILRVTR